MLHQFDFDGYFNPLLERGAVEYKQAESWETLEPKIKREALGFANRRDGGAIVVGITEESDKSFTATGLSAHHLGSYRIRQIEPSIKNCGSPAIRCLVSAVRREDKKFILIQVEPFDGRITICRKSISPEQGGPQQHTIYFRCDRLVETRPATSDDIRELVEVATTIRLQQRFQELRDMGVFVPGTIALPSETSEKHRYDTELEDF